MKFESPLELIGNTPLLNISTLFPLAVEREIKVWLKLERSNLGGSIKDRVALRMLEAAKTEGLINDDSHIIEASSGNTGIGLAMVAAIKGYKVTIVMPESMSLERRALIQAYGANLVLSPKKDGMQGSIDLAEQLLKTTPNSWMPKQFHNHHNPEAHKITAQEILADLGNDIDYMFAAVGTGGHISGCGEYLKKAISSLKIFAVEPASSAVLSGEKAGSHRIEGIGAGFIPPILKQEIFDQIEKVKDSDAIEFAKKITIKLGLLVGLSTGANLKAIESQLSTLSRKSTIVTFNYDSGERYLAGNHFC